ncbi:hypothetical protein H8356DRAFT_1341325 [Neocallimastix lanati (nom. inval.)]|nr:hypothetical protein H8356DRAFT_1341325 [Neocallimastix sp. JGI-2020a]
MIATNFELFFNFPKYEEIQTNLNNCTSKKLGYSCCSSDSTTWCGITPYNEILNKKLCWSEILGYLCYSECIKIIEIDSYSKWGVENYH